MLLIYQGSGQMQTEKPSILNKHEHCIKSSWQSV